MATIDLDDLSVYVKQDPERMLDRIKELPAQVWEAWEAVRAFRLPADYRDIDNVIILGMGGSAIGGDLVRSLVQGESRVPVLVHRDYGLPHFVGDRSLVIVSSYSGNTEETLSGFEAALRSGAKKVAVTTGGKVKELAEANGVPVFTINYKAQPRAALGYSFLPTLGVLEKLGLLWDKNEDVDETVRVLKLYVERLSETVPAAQNPAKQLARRLAGRLPVIYGAGFTAEVAHRWKTQINENAKAWAFYEVFPELNHNATVGFPMPPEVAHGLEVLFLRSPLQNRRVLLRMEVTAELLDRAGVSHESIDSEGESALAQMMSLIMLGDFTSYYLAILYEQDPSPVKVIDYLKHRLAEGK
jgi:glucose/mannose-6-phosphate isomerase